MVYLACQSADSNFGPTPRKPRSRQLYVSDDEDMAKLFQANYDLKARTSFPRSVRDIRAFPIEQLSDFTSVVKSRKLVLDDTHTCVYIYASTEFRALASAREFNDPRLLPL